jgi:hypothetical protein
MRLLARAVAAVLTSAGAAVPFMAAQAPTAAAAPTWAPAHTAAVHPGVQTFTDGAQCTANFVFFDTSNTVYIGQAAHCSGKGDATETDGCNSESLPVGTQVEVDGASRPGVMVYNSWLTMQASGETNEDACAFNDFALIRLDPADFGKVNPSIPFWGGPNGIDTNGTTAGEDVYSYGNSGLRGGVSQLSPKQGVSVGDTGNGWSHDVYTVTPGIPGDSGGAYLNSTGAGLGVLSTIQVAPLAGSNGVSDLDRQLSYMRSHSSFDGVQLAPGTEPFNPDALGSVLGQIGF